MRRDFTARKRVILGGLSLLVLADVALAAYSWQLSLAPRGPQHRVQEITQQDLLRADIRRAQAIRDNIPAIQKDCEGFEQSLFPASSGYSSVRAELCSIGRKSGSRLQGMSFKPTDIASRGLMSVSIVSMCDDDC